MFVNNSSQSLNKIVDDDFSQKENKPHIHHYRIKDKTEIEKKYFFGRKLGEGAFGVVCLVEDKISKLTWACKIVVKTKGSVSVFEQLQREINIMKQVNHPYIVKLFEVYETPKKIYLIMENYEGGELVSKIREKEFCSEEDVRIIISRLADAVAYLHDHGIVHRDLKPENILLSTEDPNDLYNIKVMDFGLATYKDTCGMLENICGTPFYMAPEVVENLGYSQQCDIWSIGVMMYLLLCGYKKECEMELHQMIENKKIEFPDQYWKDISPGARNLVESLLKFDPAQRITAREILQHPWINGNNEVVNTQTVFDLMKSYNAERRLKKVINVVRAAIAFSNGGFIIGGDNISNSGSNTVLNPENENDNSKDKEKDKKKEKEKEKEKEKDKEKVQKQSNNTLTKRKVSTKYKDNFTAKNNTGKNTTIKSNTINPTQNSNSNTTTTSNSNTKTNGNNNNNNNNLNVNISSNNSNGNTISQNLPSKSNLIYHSFSAQNIVTEKDKKKPANAKSKCTTTTIHTIESSSNNELTTNTSGNRKISKTNTIPQKLNIKKNSSSINNIIGVSNTKTNNLKVNNTTDTAKQHLKRTATTGTFIYNPAQMNNRNNAIEKPNNLQNTIQKKTTTKLANKATTKK